MSTANLKSSFDCELCIENFNQFDRKPYSVVPCGHTICLDCLNKLEINKSLCPFCRIEMQSKIPNWEVMKRLPKPSIPLVYNQLKVKLKGLDAKVNEVFFTAANEVLSTTELIGKQIELIVI